MVDALVMTRVLMEIDDVQFEGLVELLGGALEVLETHGGMVHEFQSPDAGPFFQRCIGTIIELANAQEAGSTLLIRDRQGTVRQLTIDIGQDGTGLGVSGTSDLQSRLRRFGGRS